MSIAWVDDCVNLWGVSAFGHDCFYVSVREEGIAPAAAAARFTQRVGRCRDAKRKGGRRACNMKGAKPTRFWEGARHFFSWRGCVLRARVNKLWDRDRLEAAAAAAVR